METGLGALGSVAVVRGRGSAAQYEFRCGTIITAEHPVSIRAKQMWEAIERDSGGRVRTQFYPNSQLGGDLAVLSQLRVGAVQFQLIGPGSLQAVIPAVDITDVGFAFRNSADALRALDGPLGDYVRKEVTANGLVALHNVWDSGMRQMTTSPRPIQTVDDLSGLKIRVVESHIIVDFFKALGASPTPLPVSELYTALQTKVVDGEDAPLATIEAFHIYEVQKYLTLTSHTWNGLWCLCNGDVWKSLPPDVKAIIERNNTKYSNFARRDMQLLQAPLTDKLHRQGLSVNRVNPAPFRARLRSYYAAWANAFGATEWGLLETAIGSKLG